MRIKPIAVAVAMCVTMAFAAQSASAYEVVSVKNGGTISGTISLKGKPYPPHRFKVEKTPETCGKEDRLVDEVATNKKGQMADVVILLEKVEKGKPYLKAEETAGPSDGTRKRIEGGGAEFPGMMMRPKKCFFGRYTGVVAHGKMLAFQNQDPVKHSPHTYAVKGRVKKTMHNQDLAGDGNLDLKIKFKKKKIRVLKLECDQHEHMQNWYRRVDNPYYAFSSVDGSYKIDNVPAGTYKLIAWHPKFKKDLKQKVTIAAGGKQTVDFTFKSKAK